MAGLVAGGIGLAALGTGTYFAVRTHRIQEQQDEAVRAGNSDPGFYEDQESGRRPKSQTRPGKA